MTHTHTYRQGDVLITRVDTIPEGLTPVKRENGRIVLAHGESTGHCHAIDAPDDHVLFLESDLSEMADRFLRVREECTVVHEEHSVLVLPPGDYRLVRQSEYAPGEIRNVAD